MFIILNGPSSVGKSTLARAFWSAIAKGFGFAASRKKRLSHETLALESWILRLHCEQGLYKAQVIIELKASATACGWTILVEA